MAASSFNLVKLGITLPPKRLIIGVCVGIFVVVCYLLISTNSKKSKQAEFVQDKQLYGSNEASDIVQPRVDIFKPPAPKPDSFWESWDPQSSGTGTTVKATESTADGPATLQGTTTTTAATDGATSRDSATASSTASTAPVYSSAASHQSSTASSQSAVDEDALTSGTPVVKTMTPRTIREDYCPREARLQQIRDVCEDQTVDRKRYYETMYWKRLMVDQKHKTLFCVIPKCGSTTWKTMMANMTGADPMISKKGSAKGVHSKSWMKSHHNLTYLTEHSRAEAKYFLNNYFKFIVVRHPLDRLYSTFNGKFIHGGAPVKSYKQLGDKIKKEYGKRDADDMDRTIEFSEYLKFVANTYEYKQNGHWTRYIDACNPCEIEYDYVVKLETSGYDSDYIVDKMTGEAGFFIPQGNSRRERATPERIIEQYKDVPKDVVDDVLKYYDVDMKLFGYTWDSETCSASCSQHSETGECC